MNNMHDLEAPLVEGAGVVSNGTSLQAYTLQTAALLQAVYSAAAALQHDSCEHASGGCVKAHLPFCCKGGHDVALGRGYTMDGGAMNAHWGSGDATCW